jgi:septal ring factor EnvC (AmiA/AmiB activator)
MDFVYAIPLLAMLAAVWFGARRVAKKRHEREARRRRRKRRSASKRTGPDTVSPRSDMRATDSPVTVIDVIRKPPKDRDQ